MSDTLQYVKGSVQTLNGIDFNLLITGRLNPAIKFNSSCYDITEMVIYMLDENLDYRYEYDDNYVKVFDKDNKMICVKSRDLPNKYYQDFEQKGYLVVERGNERFVCFDTLYKADDFDKFLLIDGKAYNMRDLKSPAYYFHCRDIKSVGTMVKASDLVTVVIDGYQLYRPKINLTFTNIPPLIKDAPTKEILIHTYQSGDYYYVLAPYSEGLTMVSRGLSYKELSAFVNAVVDDSFNHTKAMIENSIRSL